MESATLIPHIEHALEGWFDFKRFYEQIAEWIPDGGKWVEVGVYAGKSFSYGLIETLNLGKKVDMVAVDMFPDEWIYGMRPDGMTVWDKFNAGMKPLNGKYRVIIGQSTEAADWFLDASIDFVFIDAAHDYESVTNDINAWLPKIKPGGIIAGHDYEPYYERGVVAAVDDFFGDRVEKIPYDDDNNKFCWKVQC